MEVSTDTIITAAIVAAGVVAIAVISYRRRVIQTDSTGRDVLQILTDFKSAYDKDKGREEATDSSPKRGFKFETYCEDILSKMAEAHSDKLEHTRDEIGELAGRKVGDFVVRCGERSVVFEAKAVTSKRLTTSSIETEIRTAITNRNADYGVFVAESTKAISKDIGMFNEYDEKYLVCALSDDEMNPNDMVLKAAYKWARNRVMSRGKENLDVTAAHESIRRIQESLKKLNSLSTQCTNIRKAADAIDGSVNSVRRDIEDEIRKF